MATTWANNSKPSTTWANSYKPSTSTTFLLLETGDFMLLETGDKIILIDGAGTWTNDSK